jgi:MarR family transcriptional regulator, organic hydroperoxide resistance regulator
MKIEEMKSYLLHKVVKFMEKMAEKMMQEQFDISYLQFMILMVIYDDKEKTQKEVADCLNVTPATISKHIDALTVKKLISRHENKDNRREHVLKINTKGHEIINKALQQLKDCENELFNEFSNEEVVTLNILVSKLNTKIENIQQIKNI